ncbi:Bug family tripartite tricarboxylate transporter substrate binding protein [Nocardiopsis nanhaiensis]
MKKTSSAASALLLGLATGCSALPGGAPNNAADGDGPCATLQGETVSLTVPYSAGGGYDTLARLIEPGMAEAIGTQVIIENEAGAGGLLAINQLSQGNPDGTEVAIMNGSGIAAAVLVDAEGVEFSFDDLSYIGRVSVDDLILVTAADGPYQSWDDIEASQGFSFGSTGRGASDYVTGALLIEAFELPGAEVVAGFDGQSESELALLQGNIDGFTGPIDGRRGGVESGDNTGVLSFGQEPPEDMSDITMVSDLDIDEHAQELVDAHLVVNELGRPLVGPPDMDEDALTCLSDGLEEALQDDQVLAQAEQVQREFAFLTGAELEEEVIDSFDDLPESYLQVMRDAF